MAEDERIWGYTSGGYTAGGFHSVRAAPNFSRQGNWCFLWGHWATEEPNDQPRVVVQKWVAPRSNYAKGWTPFLCLERIKEGTMKDSGKRGQRARMAQEELKTEYSEVMQKAAAETLLSASREDEEPSDPTTNVTTTCMPRHDNKSRTVHSSHFDDEDEEGASDVSLSSVVDDEKWFRHRLSVLDKYWQAEYPTPSLGEMASNFFSSLIAPVRRVGASLYSGCRRGPQRSGAASSTEPCNEDIYPYSLEAVQEIDEKLRVAFWGQCLGQVAPVIPYRVKRYTATLHCVNLVEMCIEMRDHLSGRSNCADEDGDVRREWVDVSVSPPISTCVQGPSDAMREESRLCKVLANVKRMRVERNGTILVITGWEYEACGNSRSCMQWRVPWSAELVFQRIG